MKKEKTTKTAMGAADVQQVFDTLPSMIIIEAKAALAQQLGDKTAAEAEFIVGSELNGAVRVDMRLKQHGTGAVVTLTTWHGSGIWQRSVFAVRGFTLRVPRPARYGVGVQATVVQSMPVNLDGLAKKAGAALAMSAGRYIHGKAAQLVNAEKLQTIKQELDAALAPIVAAHPGMDANRHLGSICLPDGGGAIWVTPDVHGTKLSINTTNLGLVAAIVSAAAEYTARQVSV